MLRVKKKKELFEKIKERAPCAVTVLNISFSEKKCEPGIAFFTIVGILLFFFFFLSIIFVYLSLLPVAQLSDAPRRRLVVTGIVQGYKTKLLRAPHGSFTCLAYSSVTRDLGLRSHPINKCWLD